jgi:hypothetical protein
MHEHADGATYGSVEDLRADDIDYVIINEELVNEGWKEPPPSVYRWVMDNGRLAYGFESSRSSGLVGVWRLGDLDAVESASKGRVPAVVETGSANAGDPPPEDEAGCGGELYVCVRERVSEVSAGAKYVGGRIDVDTDGPVTHRSVLYFEDPAMRPCEYEMLEQTADDSSTRSLAIVAGRGSYGGENGRNCVPEPD